MKIKIDIQILNRKNSANKNFSTYFFPFFSKNQYIFNEINFNILKVFIHK